MAQTRSLPPPWHTPSVSPTIIAQPASAPESHHAAPLGSTSFQGHVWQRTCMQPAQSQDSVRPLAHQHVQESGHCLPRPSRPESQRSITQCSQCTGFGEESHGSLSSGSRQPQKHAQRLNMIRNHLCASEQPDHKSLETSQLEASSPARPQLCSSEAPTPEHEGHPQVYRAGSHMPNPFRRHWSPSSLCMGTIPLLRQGHLCWSANCMHGCLQWRHRRYQLILCLHRRGAASKRLSGSSCGGS